MSTQIAVTDSRLIIGGHSANKIVCLAVSIAAQCLARVLGAQGMLARTVEIGIDPPVFDMIIRPQEVARQGIAGFLDTLFHVAKEYPGEITVSDNRQVITQIHRPDKPEPKEKTSESFADIMQRIAVDHVRGSNGLTTSNGLPIRKAA